MFSFNLFLNKNRDFLHLLAHFSEIPSVGFHPLGSIRCQRCREVDLEGHWVQLRAHLIGFKKNCNDLFFFKICFKKTIFFNQFSHKGKHVFHHFHMGFHFFRIFFSIGSPSFSYFCWTNPTYDLRFSLTSLTSRRPRPPALQPSLLHRTCRRSCRRRPGIQQDF